jgi:hypothetical protein
MTPKLLTPDDVGAILGCKRTYVIRLFQMRKIGGLPGRPPKFTTLDVDEFIATRHRKADKRWGGNGR